MRDPPIYSTYLSSPAQQYATDVVVYTALFIISLAFSFEHKIPNDGGRAGFMLPQCLNQSYDVGPVKLISMAGYISKKQGRIHGSISRVRVGRGSIVVGQGQ